MSLAYDLILAVIVLLAIRRGWRVGILAGLITLLGWAVAAVIIAGWGRGWAECLYFRFLEPVVVRTVEKAIPAEVVTAMNSGADAVRSLSSLQDVLDQLGGVLGARSLQLGDVTAMEAMLRQDGVSLAQAMTKTVMQPMLIAMTECVVALAVLLVVMALFRRLARRSSRRHRGILGKTNQLLGAALGTAEGAALGAVYAIALTLAAELVHTDWLSPAVLADTTLVSGLLGLLGF